MEDEIYGNKKAGAKDHGIVMESFQVPVRSMYVCEFDSNEDDLSSSSFSSRPQSSLNLGYSNEFLQIQEINLDRPEIQTIENKSIESEIRF